MRFKFPSHSPPTKDTWIGGLITTSGKADRETPESSGRALSPGLQTFTETHIISRLSHSATFESLHTSSTRTSLRSASPRVPRKVLCIVSYHQRFTCMAYSGGIIPFYDMDNGTMRNIYKEWEDRNYKENNFKRPWESRLNLRVDLELSIANYQVYFADNKFCRYSTIRVQYEKLFHDTKAFVNKIQDLATALAMLGDGSDNWIGLSTVVVEYSKYLLHAEGLHFGEFLCSQQTSIYAMLDDLLLRLSVKEWESEANPEPWNVSVKPLSAALDSGLDEIDQWNSKSRDQGDDHNYRWDESKQALKFNYFNRTRAFIRQSLQVYWVRKVVGECEKGRLPVELVDIIVQDVLRYKGLPTERLRSIYLPSGKGKP